MLTISNMDEDEVGCVLGWAAEEGWNPGVGDAHAFFAADPEGYFAGRIDGRPVSAVSVVNHSDSFSFLGLFLCLPAFRGLGHGLAVWNRALVHAGDRTIGLDGVAAQQHNYRKSGFVSAGSTLRHEGHFPGAADPAIRPAGASDLPQLARLDAAANGVTRPAFLRNWLTAQDHRETLVLEQDGALAGFVTLRACGSGTKLGPLVALDLPASLRLIGAAAARADAMPLIIDLPEGNRSLRAELEQAGFKVPYATARMYRGLAPIAGPGLQAIATMELG